MSDQRNEPGSRQLIRMANDRMWVEGYAVGVQDSMLHATQYERILSDLIVELRGQADIWQEGDINEDRWDYPAMMLRAHADRAEARLLTLQTLGGPAGADLKEEEGSGNG